jgi:hypothetical protein
VDAEVLDPGLVPAFAKRSGKEIRKPAGPSPEAGACDPAACSPLVR